MPESLNKTKRASKIFLGQLNPFKQLRSIFFHHLGEMAHGLRLFIWFT